MANIEDRKLVHDLRGSMMVVKNLTQLIHDGTLKDKDLEQAYTLIDQECDKVIELLKDA
jgi:hypothetical protein